MSKSLSVSFGGWLGRLVLCLLSALSSVVFSKDIRLEATTLSEWVQSPKVSPSGHLIAYLIVDSSGRQRVELRTSSELNRHAVPVQLNLTEARAYWLNWISDDQLDVRVSEHGGKEQILRWTLSKNAVSRVLPEGVELGITFSTAFSNFVAPIERFNVGKRTFIYDDRSGDLIDGDRNLAPPSCAGGGSRVLRVFGDPQQMTWELVSNEPKATLWRLFVTPADRRQGTAIMSISASECVADFADSVGRDTLAVRRLDIYTGTYSTLFESQWDPEYVSIDRRSGLVDVIGVERMVPQGIGLKADSRRILENVTARFPTGFYVVDRSVQDRFWLIRHGDDTCEPVWSVIDTSIDRELWVAPVPTVRWQAKCHRRLFAVERAGEPRIEAILTSPTDRDCRRVSCDVVLLLHGGPAVRDRFITDPFAAELAAAGFMVLNVNFRGSSGFGKVFTSLDAGNWGRDIPSDVYAAIDQLRSDGYLLGKKISIGSSFGGYLSLLAATRDARVDCAIAQSSPPDLVGFISSMDKLTYGKTDLFVRVGNPEDPTQVAHIRDISPITYVNQGATPILLINGGKDMQSPLGDVLAFAKLRAQRAPVSMFVFANEGHEIVTPGNRTLLMSLVGKFIERCINPTAKGALIPLPIDKEVEYHDGFGLLQEN